MLSLICQVNLRGQFTLFNGVYAVAIADKILGTGGAELNT